MVVKSKHDEKSWRVQTIEPVGHSEIMEANFPDTNPNYVLITNTCPSPLYVSTSPSVSTTKADLIIPPWGMQLFVDMHPIKTLYLLCLDDTAHSVTLKSWEGEFDPSAISQAMKISPVSEATSLGTVTVENFPAPPSNQTVSGTVAISSMPNPALPAGSNTIGTVNIGTMPNPALPAGTNNIGDVDVLTLPPLPAGTNNIGDVDVLTLPALPTGANTIGNVNINGTPGVRTQGSTAITTNVLSVTTVGTRVQLPSVTCRRVTIIARKANTGIIYVGSSTVTSAIYGIALDPKDRIEIEVSNSNLVYIDASVAGEGISYIIEQ